MIFRRSLFSTLKNFKASRRGAVGIAFGIMYAVLAIGILESLVISQLNINKIIVQGALDNAALALANIPSNDFNNTSSTTLLADENAVLKAFWQGNGGPAACDNSAANGTPTVSAVVTTAISISVTCASVIAGSSVDYSVSSTIQVQSADIEVAMVLDNTGSMAWAVDTSGNPVVSTSANPSKLTGLKIAAYNFVEGLLPYATVANAVKVAVVPMDNDINIGNSSGTNGSQSIVKYYSGSDSQGLNAYLASYGLGRGCYYYYTPNAYSPGPATISAGNTYYSNQGQGDGVCGGYNYGSGYTFYTVPSAGLSASNWLGCVTDRDQEVNSSGNTVLGGTTYAGNPSTNRTGIDYDVSDALPNTSSLPTLYPADNINCGGPAPGATGSAAINTIGPMQIVPLTDLCANSTSTCTATFPQTIMNLLYCRDSSFVYGYPDTFCETYAGTSPSLPSALTNYGGTTGNVNTGAMIANGGTDLTIGLAWGMNMLTSATATTSRFPLSPNAASSTSGTQVDKFIILFTDGFNSLDRFNITDCSNDNSSSCYISGTYSAAQEYQFLVNMNNETYNICNTIKNLSLDSYNSSNKITIFTVGTSDADTSLLQTCATSVGDSYTNLTATGLNGALTSVLSQIVAIRFSK